MKKQRESETNVNRTDGKASNEQLNKLVRAPGGISSLLMMPKKKKKRARFDQAIEKLISEE